MPSFRFTSSGTAAARRSHSFASISSVLTPSSVHTPAPSVAELQPDVSRDASRHSVLVSNILRELAQEATPSHAANMLESNMFQIPVTLLILVNTIQLGLEADYPEQDKLWSVLEHVITAGFTLEFAIKLSVLRGAYFCSKGNILDFLLVVLSVLDVWICKYVLQDSESQLKSFSVLRVVRLSKILRMLRMLEVFRPLVVILHGVLDALMTAAWVGVMLTLVMYAFAIFCVQYVGGEGSRLYPGYTKQTDVIDQSGIMENFNPFLAFGSIPKAMLTLFNMAVLAEWTEIIRPLMIKQPWLVLIFVFFILFSTFGIMNVMIGMIVDSVMKITARFQQEADELKCRNKQQILAEIQKVVFDLDTDHDGVVTADELEKSWDHSTLAYLLDQVNLPRGFTPAELLRMLDDDGDGKIERDEFVHSFFRLIENDSFQRSVMEQVGLNQIKLMIKEMHDANQKQMKELQATFQKQMENVVLAIQPYIVTRDISYAKGSAENAKEPFCKSHMAVYSPAVNGLQRPVCIEPCPDPTQCNVVTELEAASKIADESSRLVYVDEHLAALLRANRSQPVIGEASKALRTIPETGSLVQSKLVADLEPGPPLIHTENQRHSGVDTEPPKAHPPRPNQAEPAQSHARLDPQPSSLAQRA